MVDVYRLITSRQIDDISFSHPVSCLLFKRWYSAEEVDQFTSKVERDARLLAQSLQAIDGCKYRFESMLEASEQKEFKYSSILDAYWSYDVEDWLDDAADFIEHLHSIYSLMKADCPIDKKRQVFRSKDLLQYECVQT